METQMTDEKTSQKTEARFLSYVQTKELVEWLSSDIFDLQPSMKEIIEVLRNQVEDHEKLYGMPMIQTAQGVAVYVRTETEDEHGNWNDNWNVRDGFYVIHNGRTHDIYRLEGKN